jgi:L-amino acid N-acyltransferase YncA
MPALRDIINYYITESVVTFEMVEMSLENRKTWFTQFTEGWTVSIDGGRAWRMKWWAMLQVCASTCAPLMRLQ